MPLEAWWVSIPAPGLSVGSGGNSRARKGTDHSDNRSLPLCFNVYCPRPRYKLMRNRNVSHSCLQGWTQRRSFRNALDQRQREGMGPAAWDSVALPRSMEEARQALVLGLGLQALHLQGH